MTLTLDRDLAETLRERARRQNKPITKVANDALRRGLSTETAEEVEVVRETRPVFRVKPFRSGYAPGFDPTKLKQFLNDEDDERFLRLTYGDNPGRYSAALRLPCRVVRTY